MAGRVSSVEVVGSSLARIRDLQPVLNAFTVALDESAMASAREADDAVRRGGSLPPLLGLPVSVKDHIWMRDVPATNGSLISSRIAVMYLGEIMETGAADPLYSRPGHPYTEALLSASPDVEEEGVAPRERILLTGDVPNPVNKPSGCPFRTRCPYAQDVCAVEHPPLSAVAPGRYVSCHFPLITSTGEVAPHAISARSDSEPG